MPVPTAINGISKPVLGDAPNIETATHPAFDAIDNLVVPRFTTVAALNAAITAPIQGQLAYVTETDELYRRGTASWLSASPRTKYKATRQVINNMGTYVSDTDLLFAIEPNSKYACKFKIDLQSNSNAAWEWYFFVPPGTSGFWRSEAWRQITQPAMYNTQMKAWDHINSPGDLGPFSAISTSGNFDQLIVEGEINVGATGGFCLLLWKQFTPQVSNTSVFEGSFVTSLKIG